MDDGVYAGGAGKDATVDQGQALGHFKGQGDSPIPATVTPSRSHGVSKRRGTTEVNHWPHFLRYLLANL